MAGGGHAVVRDAVVNASPAASTARPAEAVAAVHSVAVGASAKVSVRLYRSPENSHARLPRYATAEAAGMDLYAAPAAALTIPAGQWQRVPTGIHLALPGGFEAQVRPRSGLAVRHGITVLNAPGTIDADYRGEIQVALINLSREDYTLQPGDRIAQLVIAPVCRATLSEVSCMEALGESARGQGGFGSTGRRD